MIWSPSTSWKFIILFLVVLYSPRQHGSACILPLINVYDVLRHFMLILCQMTNSREDYAYKCNFHYSSNFEYQKKVFSFPLSLPLDEHRYPKIENLPIRLVRALLTAFNEHAVTSYLSNHLNLSLLIFAYLQIIK